MSETQAQGMRRIPFPVESYEHPSPPLSAKRLLNCFAEQAPNDAHSPFLLRTTPGLVYRETLGTGPLRAFDTDLVGGFYAVSGAEAFTNAEGYTSMIGNVGTASDAEMDPRHVGVSIAVSPFHVVICVPPRLYAGTNPARSLTQIDTTGFPGGGCNSIAYMDGYFVGTMHGRGNTFFISGLHDPFSWDPLDFANTEAITNILFRGIVHRGELWLLGAMGIEVWYDAGAPDFPFRRQAGGVIPYSVVPYSAATLDGSVWWLAHDGCVYRSQGYRATRVSTHAIEAIIESGDPDSAAGLAYMQEGHGFYVLTLQDLGRTLCYDVATQKWHDRSSSADGSGPWRALVAERLGASPIVGDAAGRLYVLDAEGTADNGVPILQRVTLPPLYAATRRAFCARAEVEMQAPPATDVRLDWSDDGGITFSGGPRIMNGADAQAARRRLVSTRLGSFRQRVFRIETRGRVSLYAMDADIQAGAS